MRTRPLAASLVAVALGCWTAGVPAARKAGTGTQASGTTIELARHAPGAFDPSRPARSAARVRYRADAQILLPLLVTSLRIASRSGVGHANAEIREVTLDSGERIQAYEFYAASVPEKARGLDRLGFFREAVIDPDGPARRTAYFGAMTVSKEQTLDEAKKAIEQNPGLAAYDVIDGLVTREAATSRGFTVTLKGRSADPAAFFSTVRAAIDSAKSKDKPTLKASAAQPLDGSSFLAAFESLLQAAAANPGQARGLKRTFVFGNDPRAVEIRGLDADRSRGRDWAARGIAAQPDAVRRLECRITARTWKVDFSIWAELAAPPAAGPAPIVIPLRVEYLARAFLRLVFERVE